MPYYILRNSYHEYNLVGPFKDGDEASNWARSEEHNPEDDPRWVRLFLKETPGMPTVFTPELAPPSPMIPGDKPRTRQIVNRAGEMSRL